MLNSEVTLSSVNHSSYPWGASSWCLLFSLSLSLLPFLNKELTYFILLSAPTTSWCCDTKNVGDKSALRVMNLSSCCYGWQKKYTWCTLTGWTHSPIYPHSGQLSREDCCHTFEPFRLIMAVGLIIVWQNLSYHHDWGTWQPVWQAGPVICVICRCSPCSSFRKGRDYLRIRLLFWQRGFQRLLALSQTNLPTSRPSWVRETSVTGF